MNPAIIAALLQAAEPAAAPAATIVLPADTPVELMAPSEVSTADVVAGTRFRLRVNKPVVVGGRTVVPVGATAYGEVTAARDAGGLGRSGTMRARLLHIALGEGTIPLEGEVSAKGTGAGSAGMAVLFAGAAGLFHRGNNAKIKAGELLTGFVAHAITFDLSGPVARVIEALPAPMPVPADAPR